MLRVADFCAERDLPLLVHSNASAQGHEPEAYVAEFEQLLRHYRGQAIVWAHAGISEIHRRHDHLPTVARLLSEHEALHVDLSWMAVGEVLDGSGVLRPDWVELIERFSDRFTIGSDVVGHFDDYEEPIRGAAQILAGLSDATRERAAHLNAERLWFA